MNFYLDFEATRFSNRIISIGCTNEKGAKFETLVKPEKGKVDNFITELTGITPEMVSDAPTADEAFNAFAEWAYANSENTIPKYFCYGDSDKDFIAATIRTMSDFKAITFAASIKALLIDYSSVVKEYLCTSSIALKKVVALIEETDEVEQRHDALEDAEMLRKVVENLQTKCTPADAEKLKSMKSAPKPGKRKAPEIFISWSGKPGDRFKADTLADDTNYNIKCESNDGLKYFDNIDTATLWVIKYLIKGKSPKKTGDVDSIRHKIKMAIQNDRQSYCGFKWEERTIQND
jgi:inhibitor of KinA sporulation pathway (predicted exonuclease)